MKFTLATNIENQMELQEEEEETAKKKQNVPKRNGFGNWLWYLISDFELIVVVFIDFLQWVWYSTDKNNAIIESRLSPFNTDGWNHTDFVYACMKWLEPNGAGLTSLSRYLARTLFSWSYPCVCVCVRVHIWGYVWVSVNNQSIGMQVFSSPSILFLMFLFLPHSHPLTHSTSPRCTREKQQQTLFFDINVYNVYIPYTTHVCGLHGRSRTLRTQQKKTQKEIPKYQFHFTYNRSPFLCTF